MNVSLKDIAQALNLSKATISWILSGQGETKGFSEATIKRVKEYANSVGYQPNQVARSLSLGKSHTLGLIIPFIGDTFYAQLAQAIETEVTQSGYSLIICSSEGDGDKEYKLIQMLISKLVDGIIISPTKVSRKGINLLVKGIVPFVLVNTYYPNIPTNYVIVNNFQGSYDLVYHIGKKGAKRIALLITDIHLYVMKQRVDGYRKALKKLNLCNDLSLEVFVERQNYKVDIINKLDYLFSEQPDVDGFFFSTHYLALEAIRYFIEHNIDYQNRFQMGCFHDTSTLDVLAPRMSISRIPIHEMGVVSVKILLENIQDKKIDNKAVILDNEFTG